MKFTAAIKAKSVNNNTLEGYIRFFEVEAEDRYDVNRVNLASVHQWSSYGYRCPNDSVVST